MSSKIQRIEVAEGTILEQPVPVVSRSDVERVVRRDYSPVHFATVMALLEGHEFGGPNRLPLGALKLADGNLEELSKWLDASVDERDIINKAEYPGFFKLMWELCARGELGDPFSNLANDPLLSSSFQEI
jgi:hypothetical protein